MLFTNLTVTKIGRNEFLVEVREFRSHGGLLRRTLAVEFYAHSIVETQNYLSTFPNRDCQRTGTTRRVANRFRSTRVGDLCFTARWDGGAGRNRESSKRKGEALPQDDSRCPSTTRVDPSLIGWELLPFSFCKYGEGYDRDEDAK